MDVASQWIEASDDDEAVSVARQLGRHAAKSELWLRNRLVLSFQGGAPVA
jgi:hypothetical protein